MRNPRIELHRALPTKKPPLPNRVHQSFVPAFASAFDPALTMLHSQHNNRLASSIHRDVRHGPHFRSDDPLLRIVPDVRDFPGDFAAETANLIEEIVGSGIGRYRDVGCEGLP